MRNALCVAAAATFTIALNPVLGCAAVFVHIDKAAQQMTVSVDGQPRYVWPVSTGRPGYDTPSGSFRAFRMEAEHFSKEWDDAPMPHSIFFTQIGHAIHGTYETRYLGSAVSHGCVRLSPEHARILYDLVKREGLLETKVVLTGRTPARAPLIARRAPQMPVYGSADERAGAGTPLDLSPADPTDRFGGAGATATYSSPAPRFPVPFGLGSPFGPAAAPPR